MSLCAAYKNLVAPIGDLDIKRLFNFLKVAVTLAVKGGYQTVVIKYNALLLWLAYDLCLILS